MKSVKMLTIPRLRSGCRAILVVALGLMVCQAKVSQAAPMGTAFTYNGRLIEDNNPADGLYDFEFALYDGPDPTLDTQVGSIVAANDVNVIDGYFTLALDFGGAVFTGDARWLEIAVRPGVSNDPNDFSALSPLQELTPTPYAIYAQSAEDADTLDGQHASSFLGPGSDYGRSGVSSILYEGTTALVNKYLGKTATAVNADKLDGQHGFYYQSASNINSGTLNNARFSARSDLSSEGYLGNASGDIAQNNGTRQVNLNADKLDGQHASAFSTGSHKHYSLDASDGSPTNAVYVDSSGEVGVGDTGADAKLDVLNTGSGLSFRVDDSSDGDSTPFVIDAYGNVGIGVANPAASGAKLEVNGAIVNNNHIVARGSGRIFSGDGYFVFAESDQGENIHRSVNDLYIRAGGSDVVVVDGDNARVGVGDSSPDAKLDISNTASGASFRVDDSSGDTSPFIIDADGEVGVGDSSPEAKLDILNTGSGASFRVDDSSDGDTSPFIIDAAGKVGIGKTNPGYKLDVNGDIGANHLRLAASPANIKDSGGTTRIQLYDNGRTYLADDDGLIRFSVDTDGYIGVNIINPERQLDVNGKVRIRSWETTGATYDVQVQSDGDLVRVGLSSRRYKKEIEDLEVAPEAVLKLRPVRFRWKETSEQDIGLIAEEAEELMPQLVIYDEQGRPEGIKYDKLPLYLLGALKEMKTENEVLRTTLENSENNFCETIKKLQAENESLKLRLTTLERMMHGRMVVR